MSKLATYVSHKEVQAGRICGVRCIAGNTRDIVAELVVEGDDGGLVFINDIPADFNARGTPNVGDWFVRYQDGYVSWSPAGPFEDGYKRKG